MMNSIFGAYLEDFGKIKVVFPKNEKFTTIFLQNDKIKEELIIDSVSYYADEVHLFASFHSKIFLHEDYFIKINENLFFPLSLGKITRSPLFDEMFYYDGPLGVFYSKEQTKFKLWSPVAKEIILVLNDEKYPLEIKEKGVWEITIDGNLDCAKYYYLVRINQEFVKCLDPYAVSSASNHEFNYVIDLNKTVRVIDSFKTFDKPYIYEINFRDLNHDLRNDDSAYLKSIEKIPYFKSLNITHLQIMPVFGFGGVCENIKNAHDEGFMYNWGYNPIQYFTLSGWYSQNPNSPYDRINEFKTFINRCKENDLGINLDVVFNHVYNAKNFSLGILVPGYVYRTNQDGFMMNSSYCGNDIRTEGKMNRKFILDNLKFWQDEYKIDGFRFDLMGLIDNQTITDAYQMLKEKNPFVLLYGEGWYMQTTLDTSDNANLSSAKLLYPVSFFNDYFRSEIGGKLSSCDGFIQGKNLSSDELYDLMYRGSMSIMPFKDFTQSINYVECHDNLTIFDKTKQMIKNTDELINRMKLALGIVVLSRGICFIHAGEELCRTKQGIDNSYNMSDEINHMPWENLNTKFDLHKYLQDIIKMDQILRLKHFRIYKKTSYYEARNENYQIIIKNDNEPVTIYFAPNSNLVFDNQKITNIKIEVLELENPGIWIVKK